MITNEELVPSFPTNWELRKKRVENKIIRKKNRVLAPPLLSLFPVFLVFLVS